MRWASLDRTDLLIGGSPEPITTVTAPRPDEDEGRRGHGEPPPYEHRRDRRPGPGRPGALLAEVPRPGARRPVGARPAAAAGDLRRRRPGPAAARQRPPGRPSPAPPGPRRHVGNSALLERRVEHARA